MNDELHRSLTQDHAVRIALLEQSMGRISEELHGINRNIGWLVKLVAAAIVTSIIAFVIRGGLVT